MSQTTYSISRMTCEHCVAAVTEEIRALPGVTDAKVDKGRRLRRRPASRVRARVRCRSSVSSIRADESAAAGSTGHSMGGQAVPHGSTYQAEGEVSRRLLDALPQLIVGDRVPGPPATVLVAKRGDPIPVEVGLAEAGVHSR
jgi:copper chaperone CopZ